MGESRGGIAETLHLPALAIHLPAGFVAMQGGLRGQCMSTRSALRLRMPSAPDAVREIPSTAVASRANFR